MRADPTDIMKLGLMRTTLTARLTILGTLDGEIKYEELEEEIEKADECSEKVQCALLQIGKLLDLIPHRVPTP